MNGDWSMLDTSFHQVSGLHSFTPEAALRLLAVASQDNAATGLEVLWQICASLQRLGYPVVVLDGTAQESADSPGLIPLPAESGYAFARVSVNYYTGRP